MPVPALLLAQTFRVPVEIVLAWLVDAGKLPPLLSYHGTNFDILTGLTALPVAWALHRGLGGRRLALVWNALGSLLLLNIVVIAVVSTPIIGLFGPDLLNTWVMFPPFAVRRLLLMVIGPKESRVRSRPVVILLRSTDIDDALPTISKNPVNERVALLRLIWGPIGAPAGVDRVQSPVTLAAPVRVVSASMKMGPGHAAKNAAA
jgi:hypothetical protein